MTEVSTAYEIAEAVIEQFATLFKTEIEPYTYKYSTESIEIYNHDNKLVLTITPTKVIMRDIIRESIEQVVLEHQKNALLSLMDNEKNPEVVEELKKMFSFNEQEIVYYVEFEYSDNPVPSDLVLSLRSTENINIIKNLFMEDLKIKWNMTLL